MCDSLQYESIFDFTSDESLRSIASSPHALGDWSTPFTGNVETATAEHIKPTHEMHETCALITAIASRCKEIAPEALVRCRAWSLVAFLVATIFEEGIRLKVYRETRIVFDLFDFERYFSFAAALCRHRSAQTDSFENRAKSLRAWFGDMCTGRQPPPLQCSVDRATHPEKFDVVRFHLDLVLDFYRDAMLANENK
jgi:hypothetical protein